jgi:glycosyltransferase involved in cell wall biosynthesis
MRLLTGERKDRLLAMSSPVTSRVGALWQRAVAKAPRLKLQERIAARRERPQPELVITPMPRTLLVVTMVNLTAQSYAEAGQLARLSAALARYERHFDEVVLVTPDRVDFSDQLEAENVSHMRSIVPGPKIFRTAVTVARNSRLMRRATAVMAFDEPGAVPGWLAARLSGSGLTLSVGAPWAPPRSLTRLEGLKAWPVRKAMRRITDVTIWEGEVERDPAENASPHWLPSFVDADLYCPLVTTDPARPRMVGAFLNAADTASAIGLIGVADRLKRDGHNVMFRVFLLSGAAAEVQAAALQGDVAERSAPIEFLALPRTEMLPDVISRLRICLSFGSGEALPFTLRAMSSGVPCVVVGASEAESGERRRGWRDFVLHAGTSNEDIAHAIEALFREPGLRLRMGREGRRLVIARHSLDAIAREEAAVFKGEPLEHEAQEAEPEFNANDEAEKLAAMLEALGVTRAESKAVAA